MNTRPRRAAAFDPGQPAAAHPTLAAWAALDSPSVVRRGMDTRRELESDYRLSQARRLLVEAGCAPDAIDAAMVGLARSRAVRDPQTAPEAIADATDGSPVGWRR